MLKHYRLGPVLGRGGAGEVRAATHIRSGLLAAIKRTTERAGHEARTIANLDHPNVVRIFDTGEDDEGTWIAMERATGTLSTVGSATELIQVLDAVLAGLAAAHAIGALHGDIKPSNILLREDGTPILADFGLAGSASGGTPAYLAPEGFTRARRTPATDLYSVGCVAYTLVHGSPPYGHGSWHDLAQRHQQDPIPAPLPRFPVPPELVTWIQRLLAKHPGRRFEHCADARAALQRVPKTEQVSVQSIPQPTGPIAATIAATLALELTRAAPDLPPPPSTVPDPSLDAGCKLPEAWPRHRAPRSPGEAGAGLVDLLAPPFQHRSEADALWSRLLHVERTQSPLSIRLVGPPGCGKRRLAEQFVRTARAAGCALEGDESSARVRVRWLAEHPPNPAEGSVLQLTTAAAPTDEVLELAPFDKATCRSVLARWVQLRPDALADLVERCEGHLGLAIDTIKEQLDAGVLEPSPMGLVSSTRLTLSSRHIRRAREALAPLPERLCSALAFAALLANPVEIERLRILSPEADEVLDWLEARGLIRRTDDHATWLSGATREAARPEDPTAFHRAIAATYHPQGPRDFRLEWELGRHLLAAGDLDGAQEPLYWSSADITGAGKMVQVHQVLQDLEQAMRDAQRPPSDPAWGGLYRRLAQLGPTHLGFERCLELHRRGMAMAEPYLADPEWQKVHASLEHGYAWLLNLMLLPHQAMPIVERWLDKSPGPGTWMDYGFGSLSTGYPARAHQAFLNAHAVAEAQDNRFLSLTSNAALGIAKRHLGHADTIEHFLAAREALHAEDFHSADGDLAIALGDAYRFAGDLASALEQYRIAVDVAAQGEARADPSFHMLLAIALGEAGYRRQAVELLRACERAVAEQGPTWAALMTLHRQVVEVELGAPVNFHALNSCLEAIQTAGYVDPDLQRAAARLMAARPSEPLSRWAEQLPTRAPDDH